MSVTLQEIKTAAEFKSVIESNSLVVVDFHATWCGPCKLIAPKLKKLAEENTHIVFIKVDVDEVPDIAAEYSIRAMPTIMYFKDGQKVDEVIGANFPNIQTKVQSLA